MSDSESSVASSSRSPSPVQEKSKSKASHIKPGKASSGKNEGDWEFKPPPGRVALEGNYDAGEFDWDAVNDNEDLDVWLIRVPDGVRCCFLKSDQCPDLAHPGQAQVP